MNNIEIAQQLFKTKFIKVLYQTNLDRSLLNRIIAEEIIREAPEPEDIGPLVSLLDADIDDLKKKKKIQLKTLLKFFC